jgi:D-tyrosyl-tRNA(Tyr) deacylase
MRCVVQRVTEARVRVGGETVGEIGPGLLVLVGIAPTDGDVEVRWMAEKIANLRIFEDDDGKMNRSVLDTGGAVLSVSQFTLYGDAKKGRRPSFVGAAHPDHARPVWERLCEALAAVGVRNVARGAFGEHMHVSLLNDGPVTILLDTP